VFPDGVDLCDSSARVHQCAVGLGDIVERNFLIAGDLDHGRRASADHEDHKRLFTQTGQSLENGFPRKNGIFGGQWVSA